MKKSINDLPKPPWFGQRWFKAWRVRKAIDWARTQGDLQHEYDAMEVTLQSMEHALTKVLWQMEKDGWEHDDAVISHARNQQKSAAYHDHQMRQLGQLIELENKAAAMGLALPDYNAYMRQLKASEVKMGEMTHETALAILRGQEDANTEVSKTERLDKLRLKYKRRADFLDYRHHRRMKGVDFEFTLAYEHLNISSAVYLTHELAKLHDRRHEIMYSGKPRHVIEAQLKDLDDVVRGFRNELTRCIQGRTQDYMGTGDENTHMRHYAPPDVDSGSE